MIWFKLLKAKSTDIVSNDIHECTFPKLMSSSIWGDSVLPILSYRPSSLYKKSWIYFRFFTPAQIYYWSALLWFGTFCVIFFFCFHCSDWDVNHIFHGTFEWGRKITTMEGRMVSYFYFFEIFSTPIFCGKYFGGLCMLSASDRREAAQIFEIEDILSEYLLTFFWNI